MKIIYTRKGEQILVDDTDYEELKQYQWHVDSKGYVARTIHLKETNGSRKTIKEFMHRRLLPNKANETNLQIDHKNRNKLDCQRQNLRLGSGQRNRQNRSAKKGKISSKYKGVYQHLKNSFRMRIEVDGVVESAHFATELEAAIAYNHRAKLLQGEFAYLNDVPDWEKTQPLPLVKKASSGEKFIYARKKGFQVLISNKGRKIHAGNCDTLAAAIVLRDSALFKLTHA